MHSTRQNQDGVKSPRFGKIQATAAKDRRFRDRPTYYAVYIAVTSHARWTDEAGGLLPLGHPQRGRAWPSMKYLHQNYGLAKGTISDATRDIADWGYWRIEPRETRSKGRPGNCYIVSESVALSAEFDCSIKVTSDRTSRTSSLHGELQSSTQIELQSSPNSEPQSSDHRTSKKNRSSGTDHLEQTNGNNTHTAHAAASQTASDRIAKESEYRSGESFNGKPQEGSHDNRIRISLDLASPDQLYRMKEYRKAADGEQRANADWREFLGERFNQDPDWIAAFPHTYLGRFRQFIWDRGLQRERAALEAQQQRAAAQKIAMNWDWKKRPEFMNEIWPHALRVGFTAEDARVQVDAFVRDRMGKGLSKTPLEWKMDAANWIERGMQYCLQQGTYVKRGREKLDDEIPF